MTRAEILEAARARVCGEREWDYGTPEDTFGTIAELWACYLQRCCVPPGADVCLRPADVAAMMALLKIARAAGGTKDDNWIDLAGYAACAGELDTES